MKKSKRSLSLVEATAHIRSVRANPGFLAFARVLGLRINNGTSVDALHMLQAIGCEVGLANEIVDGWNVSEIWGLSSKRFEEIGVSKHELSALRFSMFVGDLSQYFWAALLEKAAIAANEWGASK